MGRFKEHPYANTTFFFVVRLSANWSAIFLLQGTTTDMMRSFPMVVCSGPRLALLVQSLVLERGSRASGRISGSRGWCGLRRRTRLFSVEPMRGIFEGAGCAVRIVSEHARRRAARLSRQTSEDQARVLRLVPPPQGDLDSSAVMRSLVDQGVAASAAPSDETSEMIKLRSMIQAVGSRKLFPV